MVLPQFYAAERPISDAEMYTYRPVHKMWRQLAYLKILHAYVNCEVGIHTRDCREYRFLEHCLQMFGLKCA
jgi:hypothetical protein